MRTRRLFGGPGGRTLTLLWLWWVFLWGPCPTWAEEAREEDTDEDLLGLEEVSDPLEPMNRVFFALNDAVFVYFVKPAGSIYAEWVPDLLRESVRNFFNNLVTPIRAANCLLQGDLEGVGTEIVRFCVNSSAGFLGTQDPAKVAMKMPPRDEDMGLTLGHYGIPHGFYLVLPFLGPFSARDLTGWVGDQFINPIDFFGEDVWANVGIRAYRWFNDASFQIAEYDAFKKAALDPYVALRNAYFQYRKAKLSYRKPAALPPDRSQ